jgi:hypothetical protein
MKCNFCRTEVKPDCDYNQGRCPHRIPLLNIQPKDTSKGHFYVSIVKSAVRIAAGIFFVIAGLTISSSWILSGGLLLIAAEILGIVEELV